MEAQAQVQALVQLRVSVFTIFFVIVTSVLIQCGVAQHQVSSSTNERSALLDLRSSLGLKGRDWPRKTDTCQWRGVECDGNGRVIGLTISGLRRSRIGRLQPQFAVDSLPNLTSLTRFNASGFSLPGSIPDWFGERLGALEVLDLRHASVFGPIPSSFGGLTKLRSLLLAGNDLSGSVPSSLAELSKLSILDLSINSLTGPVPTELSALENLTILDLSSNFFSGPIPPGLSKISGLRFLNLSDNSLTGPIPAQLSELFQLVGLNLSKNFLSGSLPKEFRVLRSLRTVDLGDNDLDGPLPEGLFPSLSQLRTLFLRGNKFTGRVSGEFFSVPNLKLLDISRNNFTGNLPSPSSSNLSGPINTDSFFNFSNNQLYGNLSAFFPWRLGPIDLSGNYFQGTVPKTQAANVSLGRNCLRIVDQRSSEECMSFYAARGLTFDGFVESDSDSPLSRPNSDSKTKLTFVLVGVFGGIGFIVLLASILVLLVKLRKKKNNDDPPSTDQRRSGSNTNTNVGPALTPSSLGKDPSMCLSSLLGDVFGYDQIVRFTAGFSEANLIKRGHSGDIFKGQLEGGTLVAIKRVDLSSPSSSSYVSELEFYRKVSHARLVPLLGHCLENEGEKFLVYKYMPNADLASSLHRVAILGSEELHSMDWITRLKIAIGAAEILAYLHHECSPPLVHRDIQASSILLDDKFEVRLGSLSEVHAQEMDSNQNVITRLLRKPQSSDQGSSVSASVVCAHDVYCFGKVLLELVTGKLGISKNDDDPNTREWLDQMLRSINVHDKDFVTKIVDPSLILDEDLLEEVWAMAVVARSCLLPKPTRRPLMKHVLKALENPLKVVRLEGSSSARLRTTSSSRVSWSAAFFGSWRQSSLENIRDNVSSFKQTTRMGSQGSGGIDSSSSIKRLSSEIFPEPVEVPDLERQSEQ